MGVPELSAFHLRLLMTYLRMGTNHEPIAFYPYLSRKQFNNTKDKLEFIQDMVPIFELQLKLCNMQDACQMSNMNLV